MPAVDDVAQFFKLRLLPSSSFHIASPLMCSHSRIASSWLPESRRWRASPCGRAVTLRSRRRCHDHPKTFLCQQLFSSTFASKVVAIDSDPTSLSPALVATTQNEMSSPSWYVPVCCVEVTLSLASGRPGGPGVQAVGNIAPAVATSACRTRRSASESIAMMELPAAVHRRPEGGRANDTKTIAIV
jgi:hypothetical protein